MHEGVLGGVTPRGKFCTPVDVAVVRVRHSAARVRLSRVVSVYLGGRSMMACVRGEQVWGGGTMPGRNQLVVVHRA